MTTKFLFVIPALMPLYLVKINLFGLPTNIFELVAVATLLLAFAQWNNLELHKFWQENKVFCWGILLIILGLISSLLYNKTYTVSLGILKSWFLLPIIFSFVLYLVLKTREDVLLVLKSIYVSIFVVALTSIGYKILGVVTFDGRLEAFYNSPNYLAMFLAPGLFLAWYLFNHDLNNKFLKYFYYVSAVLILVSLYLTYSYAAWISILLTFLVLFYIKKAYSLKILAALVAIVLLLFITQIHNQKLLDVVNNNPRSSLASRIMIWQSSAKMLADSPIFGVGAGNFQKTYLDYQKYFPPYLEWAVPEPHNLFLAFWLQTGIIGLLGFLMILQVTIKILARSIKKEPEDHLAILLLAFFIYLILHGLADTPYWKNDLALLFWVFTFLTLFVSNQSQPEAI